MIIDTDPQKAADMMEDLDDMILEKPDRPDPELDKIWAEEATKRWAAYKEGRLKAIPYDEVMAR